MMVNANDLRSEHVLHFQSLIPLLLSVVYLVILITPWALTCVVASNPRILVRKNPKKTDYYYDLPESPVTYTIDYKLITAVNVLNTVAVVVSLPLLSYLLSRAAVIFSQRRNEKQELTVRQLFALADHTWWNIFSVLTEGKSSVLLVLGWVILALAFVLPIVRSSFASYPIINISPDTNSTNYNNYRNSIGASPGPGYLQAADSVSTIKAVSTGLQTTTGGITAHLWPYCDQNATCRYSYDPYDVGQSTLSNFWKTEDQYYVKNHGKTSKWFS